MDKKHSKKTTKLKNYILFLPKKNKNVKLKMAGLEMYLLERGAVRVTSADGGMTFAVLTQVFKQSFFHLSIYLSINLFI